MKILIKEIIHPVERYTNDLNHLLDAISERTEVMYQVPYEELNNILDELDPNPDIDIAIFNEKYSYVQSHHNRVCKILSELKKEYKTWQTFLGEARILYKKARNNILTNNKELQKLKNRDLQEAALQEEIPDLVDLVDRLEIIVNELKEEIGIVTLKADLIDKANTNINRQQKIVEDEIVLHYPVGVRVKVNI